MGLPDKALAFLRRERGLAYVTIGNFFSSVLGAFFWLILARILRVEEYGLVNYMIALASIPASVSMLGLNTTVTAYLARGEEGVLYEACSLVLVSTLVASSILAVFQPLSGLVLASMTFSGMALAEVLGRRLYGEYAFICTFRRVVQMALSVLLYFKLGVAGILVGYFIGLLLSSYRYLWSLRGFRLRLERLRGRLRFTLHSYGLSLTSTFSVYLDKLIVGALHGFHILGLYQLGYQFLMFLSVLPGSLYTYLLPEESSGRSSGGVALMGLGFSAALALATLIGSPWIVETFFPAFEDAIPVVRVMCIGVLPATAVSICNARLLGAERSKLVLVGGAAYLTCLVAGLTLLGAVVKEVGLPLSVLLARSVQAIYLWRSSGGSERGQK